jgi:hypothetical protein
MTFLHFKLIYKYPYSLAPLFIFNYSKGGGLLKKKKKKPKCIVL